MILSYLEENLELEIPLAISTDLIKLETSSKLNQDVEGAKNCSKNSCLCTIFSKYLPLAWASNPTWHCKMGGRTIDLRACQ